MKEEALQTLIARKGQAGRWQMDQLETNISEERKGKTKWRVMIDCEIICGVQVRDQTNLLKGVCGQFVRDDVFRSCVMLLLMRMRSRQLLWLQEGISQPSKKIITLFDCQGASLTLLPQGIDLETNA